MNDSNRVAVRLGMAIDRFDLNQQVTDLLLRNKQLVRRMNFLFCCSIAATVLLAFLFYGLIREKDSSERRPSFDSKGVLHVRGLAVMDAAGTTRVRLQAPLPEPVIMGTQQKRDDSVSGVMLYDKLGNERGGYVTDNSVGNAFLTLDSNTGQEVTLVAYPNGGAEFAINDDEKTKATLGALKNGPRLRLVKRGKTVFEQPEVNEAPQP